MAQPEPISRDELTAYLDGELPDDRVQVVEARLNADPALRRELNSLRQAWDMLDYLPRQEPSPAFTERTMSQIVPVKSEKVLPVVNTPRPRRWPTLVAWSVAWLVSVVAGFGLLALVDASTHIVRPKPNTVALLQLDLNVIERLRLYRHVDNLEYVRQLDRPELFGDSGTHLGLVLLAEDHGDSTRPTLEDQLQDPAQRKRLYRNLDIFTNLPPTQQQAMRQLDTDLHEEPKAIQERLLAVMDRYADWLEQLPIDDSRRVLHAPADERLAIVRELRLKPWLDRLPKVRREQLASANSTQRQAFIDRWLVEERQAQQVWQSVARNWDDIQLNQELTSGTAILKFRDERFRKQLDAYTHESLIPRITPSEKQRLHEAHESCTDQPLAYARILLELTDRYPPCPLPGPCTGPKNRVEVEKFQGRQLPKGFALAPRVTQKEGKWPDYSIQVTQVSRNKAEKGVHLKAFGPTKFEEMSPIMQEFIKHDLTPALAPAQVQDLAKQAGNWPEYPERLAELARAHKLVPPGTALPGPPAGWNAIRARSRGDGKRD